MNKTAKMIIVLTVITALSGAILSTWDGITRPLIEYHKLESLIAAISEVLPKYDNYEEVKIGGQILFIGKLQDSNETVGIAFEIEGSGFQGNISIMIGVDPTFTNITGMKVLEQVETPGLGTKIVEDPSNKENPFWFPEQFKGLAMFPQIDVVKNAKPSTDHEIQAISGATISSKAVARILNVNIAEIKNLYLSNN